MGSLEFIIVEEAKQFVPLRNDMKSDLDDAAYYTLSPSKTAPYANVSKSAFNPRVSKY